MDLDLMNMTDTHECVDGHKQKKSDNSNLVKQTSEKSAKEP